MLPLILAATPHFDFPAVQVGVAENESGPNGATVFFLPKPVMAVVDVRSGATKRSYFLAANQAIDLLPLSATGIRIKAARNDQLTTSTAW